MSLLGAVAGPRRASAVPCGVWEGNVRTACWTLSSFVIFKKKWAKLERCFGGLVRGQDASSDGLTEYPLLLRLEVSAESLGALRR